MEANELFGLLQSLDDTPINREGYTHTPIPYPGSKNRYLNKLLPYLPYDKVWVDVFGGSGSVTLARRPSKLDVYNDKHGGLTAFYRCLRDKSLKEQLIAWCDLTIHSREEFNWCRDTWEQQEDLVERAGRWYYSLIYSFGRLGRHFGRVIKPIAMGSGELRDKLTLFEDVHQRFKYVQIENLDWRHCLKDFDSYDTIFYLDPPYYGTAGIAYKYNMDAAEHVEMCQRLFDCKGFVALSGYNNPIYGKFPWDHIHSWDTSVTITTRAINTDTSNAKELGRNSNVEYLWVKEAYHD